MEKIKAKTDKEIQIMAEGGKKLGRIKKKLMDKVVEGVSAAEIEEMADKLITKDGGKPSFKMVPRYSWATCVNVNSGIVHGIPHKTIVFKKGDVVSVDMGMYYQGFHTDTSFTKGVGVNSETRDFVALGEKVFRKALKVARPGGRIFDISQQIQDSVESEGHAVIKALVGHGIGRQLHEEPQIPCFTKGSRNDSPIIPNNATLAIEVMYTQGRPEVAVGNDGWTVSVRDGKISSLFEETIAVTKNGPLVLTTFDVV